MTEKKKTKGISPTQNSLKKLRKDGYLCQVVEVWNPWVRRKKDLYGFIDIIAIKPGETLAVQTTSVTNALARKKKILASDEFYEVRGAGWRVVVHGWKKVKNRWTCKEIEL